MPSLAFTVLAFFAFVVKSPAEQQPMATVPYGESEVDVEFIDENEKEMESYDENELYEIRKYPSR